MRWMPDRRAVRDIGMHATGHFEDSRAVCSAPRVSLPFRGFAMLLERVLLEELEQVAKAASFRHMTTPGLAADVGGDEQPRQGGVGHGPLGLSL